MKINEILNEVIVRSPRNQFREIAPQVVADFKTGNLTLTQIGQKYNLHNVSLRNLLRWSLGDEFQQIMDYRAGRGVGKHINTSPEVIQQMAQMFANGRSLEEIAKHYNIHRSSIYRYLTALSNYKELFRKNQIRRGRY